VCVFTSGNSVPLICMLILKPVPHRFDYWSFVVTFEIRKCECSNLDLLFQDYFDYSGPLQFHVNLRIGFSISTTTKGYWNFDRECIDYVNLFG
jgi:hypothetical protein